jgi:hypothetical protein
VLFWLLGLDTLAAHATSSLAVLHSEYALGFVRPIKFVVPLFVKPVCDVVPFNKFETLVNVEYVLAAVADVRDQVVE